MLSAMSEEARAAASATATTDAIGRAETFVRDYVTLPSTDDIHRAAREGHDGFEQAMPCLSAMDIVHQMLASRVRHEYSPDISKQLTASYVYDGYDYMTSHHICSMRLKWGPHFSRKKYSFTQ